MSVNGSDIFLIQTLGSRYDMNNVMVCMDSDFTVPSLRLNATVILQMCNEFVFTTYKKRKHTYLEIDWDKTRELRRKEGHV